VSGACTLGTYERDPRLWGGFGRPGSCACPNCTEREAKVQAEANERRKALLALDQAMTDLRSAIDDAFRPSNEWCDEREILVGRIANANDAWYNASRFITGGSR